MRTRITLLWFLFFIPYISFSQGVFSISGVAGVNIYHSDNYLPITRDKDFTNTFGFSVGNKNVISGEWGLNIEAGYLSTNAKNVISETYYIDFGSPLTIKVDLIQYSFPLDITITKNAFNIFEYGIGVSLEGINRELKLNNPSFPNMFQDKLNIFSAGGNALLGLTFNFPGIDNLSVITNLKFRYLVSIWENAKGRDLENFNHKFLQSNLSVGVAYEP